VVVCAGSYQTNVVGDMLATIVNIQPKDSDSSGGETRESIVYRLADDMLGKLPADYVPHDVRVNNNNNNNNNTIMFMMLSSWPKPL